MAAKTTARAARTPKAVRQQFINACVNTAKRYPTLASIQTAFPQLYNYFYNEAANRHNQILVNLGLRQGSLQGLNFTPIVHKAISQIAQNIANGGTFTKTPQSSKDIKTFINALKPIYSGDNVVHNIDSTPTIALEDVCNDAFTKASPNPQYCNVWLVGSRDAYEQFFYIFKSIQSPQDYCTPYPYWKHTLYLFGLISIKKYHDVCKYYSQFNKANSQSVNIGFRAYIECLLSIVLIQNINYLDLLKKEVHSKLIDGLYNNLQKGGFIKTNKLNPDETESNQQDKENNTSSKRSSTKYPLNQILFGPPGTGKTYNTIFKTLDVLGEPAVDTNGNPTTSKTVWFENEDAGRDKALEKFNAFKKQGRIVFTTFHQSMSYEDFIEGIKPETNKKGQVTYDIKPGIFKNICDKAPKDDSNQPYVLIIDEINRGNVANIFGELITLIEDDKRSGNSEAMTCTLPYSKKEFGVPGNLYIIGTMNTADRSVEALDSALRRRFSFVEMMPKPELLEGVSINGFNNATLKDLLEVINKRIEVLKDREHQIGHSYFMRFAGKSLVDADELKEVFTDKIIPLLQEYFYGDYEKIRLVLGDGFVEEDNTPVTFAGNNTSYDDIPEKRYKIVEPTDMLQALATLLNVSPTQEGEGTPDQSGNTNKAQ